LNFYCPIIRNEYLSIIVTINQMKKAGKFIALGLIAVALSQLLFVGCLEEDKTDYYAEEMKLLQEFLEQNNITVEPTASGLYFLPSDTGTGPYAEIGDSVSIYYAGFTLVGNIIATNIESVAIEYGVQDYFTDYTPFTFKLGEEGYVIEGIEEGLTYMREGGKATLIIPSPIAVPETYTTLLYNIELIEVIKPSS
jgi:FKBP-type peptidyl-prolyl cis-trans isomerase FkpA